METKIILRLAPTSGANKPAISAPWILSLIGIGYKPNREDSWKNSTIAKKGRSDNGIRSGLYLPCGPKTAGQNSHGMAANRKTAVG